MQTAAELSCVPLLVAPHRERVRMRTQMTWSTRCWTRLASPPAHRCVREGGGECRLLYHVTHCVNIGRLLGAGWCGVIGPQGLLCHSTSKVVGSLRTSTASLHGCRAPTLLSLHSLLFSMSLWCGRSGSPLICAVFTAAMHALPPPPPPPPPPAVGVCS